MPPIAAEVFLQIFRLGSLVKRTTKHSLLYFEYYR